MQQSLFMLNCSLTDHTHKIYYHGKIIK